MKNKGDPPSSGNDSTAESRHQDTVGIGIMSMATVVLIGMFGRSPSCKMRLRTYWNPPPSTQ